MPKKTNSRPDGLPFPRVALVLQGGGALGSYQGGVCQGLEDAGIRCDWVAGVSIGALNAALIAGNPPGQRVARLREFWETVCMPAYLQPTAVAADAMVDAMGGRARKALNAFNAWRAVLEGQRGFFVPRGPAAWWADAHDPSRASFYDTTPLRGTLERLVDFDRLNAGEMRVSVMAVDVHTGNLEVFDNQRGATRGRMRPEHFMASAALPPGFPPVEIAGRYYWDGGLVSNTPLSLVLSDQPRLTTLAFQVDLWSARGPLPTNVYDAQERAKDIQYSSRTRLITDAMAAEQQHRRIVRELLQRVPAARRRDDPLCRAVEDEAAERQFSVIHLIYQDKEWDGMSKDYEFGSLTMRDHWASGLEDVKSSLAHPSWLALPPPDVPFVTHDVHRQVSVGPVAAKVGTSS
ncbi:patatin-like phospholipase family protein [Piscinibacter sp. XHJ-5]|uniref:patatin-like phospholipase family protein n=1 Tax=Piscinibacter sp. XHJ-5 TaxID=3037797 RepID=UPI0024534DCA|nr:patatin-like phospholipase family protein [Piscinibacter sp. XHJ-5]